MGHGQVPITDMSTSEILYHDPIFVNMEFLGAKYLKYITISTT